MSSGDGDVGKIEELPEEIRNADVQEIQMRTRMLENELRMLKSEHVRLSHERAVMRERISDNTEKISQNKMLPYLVGNVVEILDMDPCLLYTSDAADE